MNSENIEDQEGPSLDDKLIKDVVKITKRVVGDPIQIGNRTLTPTLEITFYGKQFFSKRTDVAPIFAEVIIKPISFLVTEGNAEWTIDVK